MSRLLIHQRKKIANTHVNYLEKIPTGKDLCVIREDKKQYLKLGEKNIYVLMKRLNAGKKNMDSEVFSIGFPPNKPKYIAAIKIIPVMSEKHDKMIQREINILKSCTKMFMNGVSPNLPLSYGDFICNNTDILIYENPNITTRYEKFRDLTSMEEKISDALKFPITAQNDIIYKNLFSALSEVRTLLQSSPVTMKSRLIINELNSGDITILYLLLAQMSRHYPEKIDVLHTTKAIMFQILVGIKIMHERIKIAHNDTHTSNFLFSFLEPGKPLNYIMGDKKYSLNTQYIIKIWDFGRVVSEKDTNIKKRLDDTAKKLSLKINSSADHFTALKLIDIYRAALSLSNLISDVLKNEMTSITFLRKNFVKPLAAELASGKITSTPSTLISKIFSEFEVTSQVGDTWNI
jgi:hypothetical protein